MTEGKYMVVDDVRCIGKIRKLAEVNFGLNKAVSFADARELIHAVLGMNVDDNTVRKHVEAAGIEIKED